MPTRWRHLTKSWWRWWHPAAPGRRNESSARRWGRHATIKSRPSLPDAGVRWRHRRRVDWWRGRRRRRRRVLWRRGGSARSPRGAALPRGVRQGRRRLHDGRRRARSSGRRRVGVRRRHWRRLRMEHGRRRGILIERRRRRRWRRGGGRRLESRLPDRPRQLRVLVVVHAARRERRRREGSGADGGGRRRGRGRQREGVSLWWRRSHGVRRRHDWRSDWRR